MWLIFFESQLMFFESNRLSLNSTKKKYSALVFHSSFQFMESMAHWLEHWACTGAVSGSNLSPLLILKQVLHP